MSSTVLQPGDGGPLTPAAAARAAVAAGAVDVTHDSRQVVDGGVFAAVRGQRHDGHDHLEAAVAAGARAVLVEADAELPDLPHHVVVLRVAGVRHAVGVVAAAVHRQPSADLALVGVTGTNGKTTTTWLVEAAVAAGGRGTGLVGTIATRVLGEATEGLFTTPEAPDLQRLLRRAHGAGADVVAMEVSSHGLALGRVAGTGFAVAVFTNLSRDHLDFHRDMDDYLAAKAALLGLDLPGGDTPPLPPPGHAVVCVDDAAGAGLAGPLRDAGVPLTTYGTGADADVRVVERDEDVDGQRVRLVAGPGAPDALQAHLAEDPWLATHLLGDFNALNAAAALVAAVLVGTGPADAVAGIAGCRGVPGRLERVTLPGVAGPTVLVDYAHTPDAVARALAVLRPVVPAGGRLAVVLGAGGDRDRAKRPLMGEAAARGADAVWVTSDNPRSEDPATIAEAVLAGAVGAGTDAELHLDLDRRRAVLDAVAAAGPDDVVLVAGKGHETGQAFADRVVPFDDRRVAAEALAGRADREVPA